MRSAELKQRLRPLQEVLTQEARAALEKALRDERVIKDEKEMNAVLNRFNYTMYKLDINPFDNKDNLKLFRDVNKAVVQRKENLETMIREGVIKDQETKEAVSAVVEFINSKWMSGREWNAITLSLSDPNPGLRTAPYVAKYLIAGDDPKAVVSRHAEMVEDFTSGPAKISYRARVMKPDHVVHLLEEEVDYSTGEVNALYIYTLFHFKKDTPMSKGPEYEPVWVRLEPEEDGKWKSTKAGVRLHWEPLKQDVSEIATTKEGALKATSFEDLYFHYVGEVPMGHGILLVEKNFFHGYLSMLKNAPEVEGAIGVKNLVEELAMASQEALGKVWYRIGRVFKPEEEKVLKGDTVVFSSRVRD